MLSPSKIFQKRLKRKRILQSRMGCHGTKRPCLSEHLSRHSRHRPKVVVPSFDLRPEGKKFGIFARIIRWIKNLFV